MIVTLVGPPVLAARIRADYGMAPVNDNSLNVAASCDLLTIRCVMAVASAAVNPSPLHCRAIASHCRSTSSLDTGSSKKKDAYWP